MYRSTILLGICLLAAVSADVSDIADEEGVLVLNEKNFNEAVAEYKHILIEFYAPWCGHCKALKPEYESAAKTLLAEGSEVRLAKVDATAETQLAEQYEVRGYPTLKFFVNGVAQEYKGGRKADEIVSWLKKKTGPAATRIESAADLRKFREQNDVAVIGLFSAFDNDKAKAFERAAGDLDVPFAIGTADELFAEINVDRNAESDTIVLLKAGDNERVQYGRSDDGQAEEVNWTSEEIARWASANQLPLVVEFSAETAPKIFGGEVKRHALLFDSKQRVEFDALYGAFQIAARKLRSRMLFILIDSDVEENARILDFFGVKSADLPEIRAIQLGDEMVKYRMADESFTAEAIEKFAEDVIQQRAKPHLLSQDLPDDWDTNAVKVLVSSNFDQIARDKSKNVLVEFYAPWCGHCKALAPVWDQLGEHYKDRDDIVIAKMDATQNEVEGIRVTGFPTLKWFPKNSDEVIDYSGDRSLEAFKRFIDSDGKSAGQSGSEEEEEEEEEEGEEGHGHDHDHDHGGEL